MSASNLPPSPPPNPAGRRVAGMMWERVRPAPNEAAALSASSSDGPVPNDLHPDQWALRNPSGGPDIHLPDAWKVTVGDNTEAGPLIAFLDTGMDLEHADLKANIWTNPGEIPGNGIDDDGNGVVDDVHGYDAFFQTGNPADDADHGTHTAGIAAAVGDNGQGITGVMQKARLLPVKLFVGGWLSTDEATERAMAYARNMKARIVNHSWGGPYSVPTERSFKEFPEALHVVAAGNSGTDNDQNDYYPGNLDLDNVIVVGASDRQDHKLPISQYGALNVDVTAPGEEIYSTVRGGGYAKKSATSFATPHVTGIAGLIASAFPHLSPQQIKERIIMSSDRIPSLRNVSLSGGRVNAAAALEDDRVAPGVPRQFRVSEVEPGGAVTLSWLTPADDGEQGGSARVEVRVLHEPITEKNFSQALPYLTPDLTQVGQPDYVRLIPDPKMEPAAGPFYFAAQSIDNAGNRSAIVTTSS